MPQKSENELTSAGWKIKTDQKIIIDEEALARGYNSSSALVRDIFDAWIDENHKSNPSSGVSEK